jgi:hypothetical protein
MGGAILATNVCMRSTLLPLALLAACGGATSVADQGPEADAASDSPAPNGSDVALQNDPAVGRNPDCPPAVPAAGGSCKPSLVCEYGGDAHHLCTTRGDCVISDPKNQTNFKWVVTPPVDGCGTNGASCPASFSALAAGSPCPGVAPDFAHGQTSSFCSYQEGLCACVSCGAEAGGLSSMWACRQWGPSEDGCPPDPPLSGDACSMPSQQCSYGGFCRLSVGPTMICEDGYWRQGGGLTGSCIILACGVP